MKYTYEVTYPDGETELSDEVFDTEEEADEAALYYCSCFKVGGEVMSMSGGDYLEGDCDYEIIEIDDD